LQTNPPDSAATKHSKKLIVLIIALAAVAAVAALVILSPSLLTVHDSGAIGFGASVNATSLLQNQTLKVDVSVRNSLYVTNTLPLSGDWKVQNLSMGPCTFYQSYPYGIAVYQGRYTLENISSGTQLEMYAPGGYFCGVATLANTFTFKPQQNVSSYIDLQGYWTAGETTYPGGGWSEGVLHPFLPGVYTLVVGDEWGHTKFLYFQVGGIALNDFSLCPSNCVYPSPYLTGEIYLGGPSPLKSLQLIVNGTDEGVVNYGDTQTDVILIYKGGFQNTSVVTGEAYSLRFIATFEDNSNSTATTVVTA
jgi:hypothetical protein